MVKGSSNFSLLKTNEVQELQFTINSNNKRNQMQNTLPIAELISLKNTMIGSVIIWQDQGPI